MRLPLALQRSQWLVQPSVCKPGGEAVALFPSFCRPHVSSECQTAQKLYHPLLLLNLDLVDWETETEGENSRVFPSTSWLWRRWMSTTAGWAFCFLPSTHCMEFPVLWQNIANYNKNTFTVEQWLCLEFVEGLSVSPVLWSRKERCREAKCLPQSTKGKKNHLETIPSTSFQTQLHSWPGRETQGWES